jgi:hypothetical protein
MKKTRIKSITTRSILQKNLGDPVAKKDEVFKPFSALLRNELTACALSSIYADHRDGVMRLDCSQLFVAQPATDNRLRKLPLMVNDLDVSRIIGLITCGPI